MAISVLDDYINFLQTKHGEENWVTVYKSEPIGGSPHDAGMYCALVSKDQTNNAMDHAGWDLMTGSGGPGFSTSYENNEKLVIYHNNIDGDFLRVVLNREFHGRKENYVQILEEFTLIFNLYFDNKTNCYIDFDDAGNEVEVIKITENEVTIRRRYLRAFMAAKQMNLLLYFESTWHFTESINLNDDKKDPTLIYTIYSGPSYVKGYSSFIRILGKKLIQCGAIDECGIWPFEKEKKYQEFIIGGDSDEPITYTSDPDKLANYFGKNPEAPHFLTPVFFRNEVMQKYYGSSQYEIVDSRLSRIGSWNLRFDNNSSDHIAVFLGDLGRDLPETEQTYWKSFNLIPDNRKISKTNFERSFLGNFYDPEKAEHIFRSKFVHFQEYWCEKYGWQFFLPLSGKDQHFWSSLRSLLTNEQSEFDSQILALAQLTIDSINVKELRKILGNTEPDSKSIYLVSALLKKLNSGDEDQFISLLRSIQSVRSTGVAHRKGTEYEKIITKLNIAEDDFRGAFDSFLLGLVSFFDELIELDSHFQN